MYEDQILMHKDTFKAVQLIKTSILYSRNKTDLLDLESNKIFKGLLSNYKELYDEFDRPFINLNNRKWDNRVLSYKIYLKPQEKLLELREASYEIWKNWLIDKLLCRGSLANAFADGGVCWYVQQRFLKEHKAEPVVRYMQTDYFDSPNKVIDSRMYYFYISDVKFLFNNGDVHRVVL